ncbi:nucleoside hydrolase [Spiroplasma taiwanense]|uniref:nucleoside hydrolase n=1 Tax=Spiroplasma taiwanense TaxID=2145 RepID=UPI00040D8D00|nr:nucleoside hydrolase [Spiroplasma taiwanense]
MLLKNHAVFELYNKIMALEEIILVTLASLTNIAMLLTLFPKVKNKIKKILMLCGSFGRENKGIYSEFNAAFDPEALKIVLESKIEIILFPMDLGLKALIKKDDIEKIKLSNKFGEVFYSLFKKYRGESFETGLKMYDSLSIIFLLNPFIFKIQKYYVSVDTQNSISAGTTYIDFKNYLKQEPNINVAVDLDEIKFNNLIVEKLINLN